MNAGEGKEYLALSGIQHFAFCPRQWALVHIEQLWEDNILTFRGQELHQKTNNPFVVEKRKDKIVARAVPIASYSLRLYGVADVIEFERAERGVQLEGRRGLWRPLPVEYKVGRPKPSNWDTLQLCAQAVCLEEMFSVKLEDGQIYYGKTRKRLNVSLDEDLRAETKRTADLMHETFEAGITPDPNYSSKCERCSLLQLCVPQLSKGKKVRDYLFQVLKEHSDD